MSTTDTYDDDRTWVRPPVVDSRAGRLFEGQTATARLISAAFVHGNDNLVDTVLTAVLALAVAGLEAAGDRRQDAEGLGRRHPSGQEQSRQAAARRSGRRRCDDRLAPVSDGPAGRPQGASRRARLGWTRGASWGIFG